MISFSEVVDPEQLTVPVESGRDSKGYLEMVNGPLRVARVVISIAQSTVALADQKIFTCFREIDRAICSFFCSVGLFIIIQQRKATMRDSLNTVSWREGRPRVPQHDDPWFMSIKQMLDIHVLGCDT